MTGLNIWLSKIKRVVRMSTDLWRVKYSFVLGNITDEEFNFIEQYIGFFDDDAYHLTDEDLPTLKKLADGKPQFERLMETFEKEVKKGKGYFGFKIL